MFVTSAVIRAPVLLSRKFLDAIFMFYESENFSNATLHRISGSKIVGSLFTTKVSLTWGVQCEKLNFRIYFISFVACVAAGIVSGRD